MKIGIDISQVIYQGSGVARYTHNLINALVDYDQNNEYVFFFSSLRQNLPADIEQKIKARHQLIKLKIPPTGLDIISNSLHFSFINQLMRRLDVFISSDWTQPKLDKKTKSITIVHDLVYLKYPETLPQKIINVQKRRMNWVKKEVDLIIADSISTKDDLVGLLGIEEKRIKVIYPAVEIGRSEPPRLDKIKNDRTSEVKKYNNYILSVAKLEPRKNIPRLIKAFQQANLKDTELLIVGPIGWSETVSSFWQTNKVSALRIPSNIKFLGYLPDSDLYQLYKNALFFIYPSFYEGFGYPVIEAMSLGCSVACSNNSSLGEIAGNNAITFNPNSIDEIKTCIIKLAKDQS